MRVLWERDEDICAPAVRTANEWDQATRRKAKRLDWSNLGPAASTSHFGIRCICS